MYAQPVRFLKPDRFDFQQDVQTTKTHPRHPSVRYGRRGHDHSRIKGIHKTIS